MLEFDKDPPEKLVHREITEKIIGTFFEVHGELNILKALGIKVGLLINFERLKVEYKRLVF